MKALYDALEGTPKLALSRVETAAAIGQSPATVDRLTKLGLLNPSRATRRPMYSVDEIKRFLRDTRGGLQEGEVRARSERQVSKYAA